MSQQIEYMTSLYPALSSDPSSKRTDPPLDKVKNSEDGTTIRPDPYDSWAEIMLEREILSQDSVYQYGTLWKAWCDWLELRSRPWHTVDGLLIQTFLQGAAPGQGGRRKAINAKRMSAYTRQRYWRILSGVYAKAARDGIILDSPMLDVPIQTRPRMSTSDRSMQIFPADIFERLHDSRVIESIIPVKTSADWWHLRDQAILALLVDTGITPSELIALRGTHLVLAEQKFSVSQKEPTQLAIKILESANGMARTLAISPSTTPLLTKWLQRRKFLLEAHFAKNCAPTPNNDSLPTLDSQWPLFIARYMRGRAEGSPIDVTSLYLYTSKAIKRLQKTLPQSNGVDVNTPHQATGPAVIRNTVIHQWLNTFGPEETKIRAGMRSTDSLRFYSEAIESMPRLALPPAIAEELQTPEGPSDPDQPTAAACHGRTG